MQLGCLLWAKSGHRAIRVGSFRSFPSTGMTAIADAVTVTRSDLIRKVDLCSYAAVLNTFPDNRLRVHRVSASGARIISVQIASRGVDRS